MRYQKENCASKSNINSWPFCFGERGDAGLKYWSANGQGSIYADDAHHSFYLPQ